MARASASGDTYYRVVVETEYSGTGSTRIEHFGPYSTMAPATAMLKRHAPTPRPGDDVSWWCRVTSSHIEKLTGSWEAVE